MDAVAAVAKLHHILLRVYPGTLSVKEVLETQAETLHKEHQRGNTAVCVQISNWFSPLIAQTPEVILNTPFTLADARLTVAREHGFADWELVDENERLWWSNQYNGLVNEQCPSCRGWFNGGNRPGIA